MTSTKSLGTSVAGGASGLRLWICYRVSGSGGTATTVGLGIFDTEVAQNTRTPITMTGIISGLAANTYEVGVCGHTGGSAARSSSVSGMNASGSLS